MGRKNDACFCDQNEINTSSSSLLLSNNIIINVILLIHI